MKDTYIFPAIFHSAPDGVSIKFPDLPGCLPCADNFERAFTNAKEALQLHIYGMEKDGEPIPEPGPVDQITLAANETLTLIEAWMPPFREKMLNKAVTKTVTVPRWLDILAKREHLNYSRLLQDALKKNLGVTQPSV